MTTNLLSETIKEINDIQDKLKKMNVSKADAVKQKFCSCIRKNKGFKVMCDTSCLVEGEAQVYFEDQKDLSVSDVECYKYARLVSCDVECTSSQHKSFFRDNQYRFTMHNLKMTFVTHCNSASLSV
jgi:hypothetical protein